MSNYFSLLTDVRGKEITRLQASSSLTSLVSSNVTFWESNLDTSNVLYLLPNPSSEDDKIKIGTGPSAHHLLFRNNNEELTNVTISGNLSLTADGFLDVVGGPGAGSITVSTVSGNVYSNITQIKIDDTTGLLASNPALNLAEITYSNNIIYANSFVAFVDGTFPTTFTDTLDSSTTGVIDMISPQLDLQGPPGPPPIPNTALDTGGSTIKIFGPGVGQFLPTDLSIGYPPPGIQPITSTNPTNTVFGNVYTNPPLIIGDETLTPAAGFNKPAPAALEFYGDSGGPTPFLSPGGFVPMKWYTKSPVSTTNPLTAQRNFHYSETSLETNPTYGNLPPDPYQFNTLEMRNYLGPNVFSESYIGIYSKNFPSDTKLNRWEWKVHEDYNIDMLPYSYKSNINEVNKISHIVDFQSGKTQLSLATNLSGIPGPGNGDVMLEFSPSNPNDPSQVPTGQTTLYQKALQIWQTDASIFSVQLTREATGTTEAALISKGGLGIVKQSHFGDRLWLYSNTVDNCSILFRPFDLGVGAAEIQYNTSNVLSFQMPDLVANPGSRTLRNRLELRAEYSQLGANDVACSFVNLQNKDGLGLQLFNSAVNINRFITDEIDFKVYSKQLESTTTPLLYISGANVSTSNNYFRLSHVLEGTIGRALTLEEEHPGSGPRSRIKFNESGDINTWIDFHTANVSPTLRMTSSAYYIGLDAEETNTTYIHYTWNPNETNKKYFSKYAKEYKIQFGRRTALSQTALLNIDGRKIEYFQEDGVDQPESMNVMSTTSDTIVAMSFNADSNAATANNYVQINPGQSGIMGFKSSTSNVEDALVIGSETARDSAKYGVPFVGVSNTAANHLAADYATPFGIVYSSDEDRYCYYNNTATELTCFSTQGEVCLEEQTTYNDLYTWEIGKDDGCMVFANVETTNLQSNVGKPDAEVSDTSERIYTPSFVSPGTFFPAMLNTIMYHCWTQFPEDLGVDDCPGDTASIGSGGARIWEYSGRNSLLGDRRLVFDRPFSYIDGAYVGFDMNESVVDNLPQGDINVVGTIRTYNFRKQYAPYDGWISGVQLKHPGFVELRQGDTSWNGSNPQFKGFAGLYLSNVENYINGSVSSIRNPGQVRRYLKKWQFTSNSDTETITLEGIENIDLPSEEWVFVAKGEPLPQLHFNYFAGTENARIRMLSFDWSVLQTSDAFGRWWDATIFFTFKPPILLNRYRGDQRWDLTNVPTS